MLKKIQLYIVPILSLIIFATIFTFTKPTLGPTGMAVSDINPTDERTVTAKVTLKLSKNELIPKDSLVMVSLDDREASIPIKEFIKISNEPYEYAQGTLEIADYEGYGYIGDYTYSIDIENFNLDTKVLTGEHTFTTKIVYNNHVLYKKETTFTVENE